MGKAGRGLLNGRSGIDFKHARTKMPPRRIGPSPDMGFGGMANAYTVIQQWRRAFIPDDEEGLGGSLVPIKFIFEDGVWKVVWNTAKATEHSYKNAGKIHVIKFGAGDLSAPPIPPFPLEIGNNDFYLRFDVDKTGVVVDDSVELTTSDPVTKVVKPTRPHGGDDKGVYKQSVGRITVSATEPPVWIPYNTGTQLFTFIPEIEESGGDADQGIYNNYNNGIDTFKKLKQLFTSGFKILRPMAEEGGDTIDFRELRTVGTTTGGTNEPVPVLHDETDTAIRFRPIKQREDEPQIKVELNNDAIQIKGNDNTNDYSGYRCTGLSIKDGLVAGVSFGDKEGTEGFTGSVEIYHEFVQAGNSVMIARVRFNYENGILKSVDIDNHAGEYTNHTSGNHVVVFWTQDNDT